MLEIKVTISVYVDGVKEKEFDNMLDALTYVHLNRDDRKSHKVQLKTEKEYKVLR